MARDPSRLAAWIKRHDPAREDAEPLTTRRELGPLLRGRLPPLGVRAEVDLPAGDVLKRLGKRDSLRLAMAAERKVSIRYTRKRDGVTQDYEVRPYSTRMLSGGKALYAQDHKHGGKIHAFYVDRIEQPVRVMGRAWFKPRWPTEPETI